jgi:hypothetical protein
MNRRDESDPDTVVEAPAWFGDLLSRVGGVSYSRILDGWTIRWISDGPYRHICLQQHPSASQEFLVILQNPGSLSGDGASLKTDLTLRILRKAFEGTGLNPVIVNLFDFATPKPSELLDQWELRDKANTPLVYELFQPGQFAGYTVAFGDYLSTLYARLSDVDARIEEITGLIQRYPKLAGFKNKNKTPMHPRLWQTSNLTAQMRSKICEFAKTAQ